MCSLISSPCVRHVYSVYEKLSRCINWSKKADAGHTCMHHLGKILQMQVAVNHNTKPCTLGHPYEQSVARVARSRVIYLTCVKWMLILCLKQETMSYTCLPRLEIGAHVKQKHAFQPYLYSVPNCITRVVEELNFKADDFYLRVTCFRRVTKLTAVTATEVLHEHHILHV